MCIRDRLKVAPEHVAGPVLSLMGKPEHKVYEEFTRQFYKMNEKIGKEQYLVPYLMSSHPGSTLKEAVELAEYCRCLLYTSYRFWISSRIGIFFDQREEI